MPVEAMAFSTSVSVTLSSDTHSVFKFLPSWLYIYILRATNLCTKMHITIIITVYMANCTGCFFNHILNGALSLSLKVLNLRVSPSINSPAYGLYQSIFLCPTLVPQAKVDDISLSEGRLRFSPYLS